MMYSKCVIIGVALAGSIAVSGCQTTRPDGSATNQTNGTILGAAGGAVAGGVIAKAAGVNPLVGVAIGAVAGGLIGNAIGTALDEDERHQLALATQRAAASAPVGERVTWSGPRPKKKIAKKSIRKTEIASTSADVPAENANPASGWVVPVNEKYTTSDGQTCRDLEQHAEKDGQTYTQKVTACETKSGWQIPS